MSNSIDEFKRFAAGGALTPAKPEPPFPKIPKAIKARFPDLAKEWEEYEKQIEVWQKLRQTN